MGFTQEHIQRLYPVPWIVYEGERRGSLVAAGSGMMMAMMDLFPLARCLDIDTTPAEQLEHIVSAAQMLARYEPPLMLMGWHTIKLPPWMPAIANAVAQNGDGGNMLTYAGGGLNVYGPAPCESLEDAMRWCERAMRHTRKSPLARA